jgi:hypothetical protein
VRACIGEAPVQQQYGSLYEAINPVVAEGEADKRQTVPERSRTSGFLLLTRGAGRTLY